jgi:DNA-binding FadR family transcriptional regulator
MSRKSAHFAVRAQGNLLRVHGTVAREIGMAIVSGMLKPGQPLDGEIEAASSRKVSRNTYREALRMLVAKGLIVSRTRTGTRVSEIAEWNVLDPDVLAWTFSGTPRPAVIHALFELRSVVEPAAAALAAGRRRPRQLELMKRALAEMKAQTLNTPAGRAADSAFHAALLESTFNPFVVSLSRGVTGAITALTEFKLRLAHVLRDPVADHEAVYQAILAQDPQAAREAMNNLIRLAILDIPVKHRPRPPQGAGGAGSALFALLAPEDGVR